MYNFHSISYCPSWFNTLSETQYSLGVQVTEKIQADFPKRLYSAKRKISCGI
jgi:hypothetical protein